jgi:hypothetical protein
LPTSGESIKKGRMKRKMALKQDHKIKRKTALKQGGIAH